MHATNLLVKKNNNNMSLEGRENMSIRIRKNYLDIARVLAIISISLNHAVNRSYDNYSDQRAEFLTI